MKWDVRFHSKNEKSNSFKLFVNSQSEAVVEMMAKAVGDKGFSTAIKVSKKKKIQFAQCVQNPQFSMNCFFMSPSWSLIFKYYIYALPLTL